MKGLILAGGRGTRLYPLTKTISKQLLPVYDKPMIYYPLATLMLAGIREIAVIVTPEQEVNFRALLGDGGGFGINLTYLIQPEARGLADAYLVGERFLDGAHSAMILGDNLFYGSGLGKALAKQSGLTDGAMIFGAQVSDPQNYGVIQLSASGSLESIEEKPKQFIGNLAVPGLYFLDGSASSRARDLLPSPRGELEITDLLMTYQAEASLHFDLLPRGTVWLDMGTPDGLAEASDFVRIVQRRQKMQIACLEEVALNLGLVSEEEYSITLDSLPEGSYRDYLRAFENAGELKTGDLG